MQRRDHVFRIVALSALLVGASLDAQRTPQPTLFRATRTEIAGRVAALETQTAGAQLKGDAKVQALSELATLRNRLARGDFQVGDRFLFTVTIDSSRTDTIVVRDNNTVTVTSLPDLSLNGVLRSELDGVLEAHVLRYLKNARVNTVPLTSMSISGAVARPGFYWASPDRPLSELIMMAGGPSMEANIRELEVRRASNVVLRSKDSREAMIRGYTIEQMDIRSGDEVKIPTKRKISWGPIIQLLFVASSLFFAGVQFIQWYYSRQE